MADLVTFGLAYAAYVLLGAAVVLRIAGRLPRALTVAVAAVALTHVALVWGLRFDWSLENAVQKSLAGFAIFHAALAAITLAALTAEPLSGRLVLVAFPVVTAGALGAAFRYDYVSGYRFPLLAALAATVGLAVWGARRRGAVRASRPDAFQPPTP